MGTFERLPDHLTALVGETVTMAELGRALGDEDLAGDPEAASVRVHVRSLKRTKTGYEYRIRNVTGGVSGGGVVSWPS